MDLLAAMRNRFDILNGVDAPLTLRGFTFTFRLATPEDNFYAETTSGRSNVLLAYLCIETVAVDGSEPQPLYRTMMTEEEQTGKPILQVKRMAAVKFHDWCVNNMPTGFTMELVGHYANQIDVRGYTHSVASFRCPICANETLAAKQDKAPFCSKCGGYDAEEKVVKPMVMVKVLREANDNPLVRREKTLTE